VPGTRLLAATTGVGLILAAFLLHLQQEPVTVGDLDAVTAAPDPAEPAPAAIPPAAPPSGPTPPALDTSPPDTSTRGTDGPASGADGEERSETADAGPPSEPVSLVIPAIDVDAAVVPVGLEPDRAMEIPADVREVGWFEPGVVPGAAGSAVLAGHVDSRSQGAGAFLELRRLDVGDAVTLAHDEGEETTWRVVARTRYPKDELPLDTMFAGDGDPQLVLVTCGGDFDDHTARYAENVVVYAERA
jgi:sortase (surface protein transpeptidase)